MTTMHRAPDDAQPTPRFLLSALALLLGTCLAPGLTGQTIQLLVDADGRLSGILTDSDYRRHSMDDPSVIDRPVSEVMTRRPQHLVVDDLVRDAVRVVRENQFDEIPVVDHDGRPVGLVDVQDLISMKVVTE